MNIGIFLRSITFVGLAAGVVAACGSKGSSGTSATNTTANGSGSGGMTSSSGSGGATTSTSTTSTTTTSSTTATSSTSASTSASTTASSSSSTAASSSSTGGNTINGCNPNMAVDKTNNKLVSVTGIQPWSLTHQVCVKVTQGAQVQWSGDFSTHPIAGGTPAGTLDAASPITIGAVAVNGKGSGTLNVTFMKSGAFPYYCTVHQASMQGVVFVQ